MASNTFQIRGIVESCFARKDVQPLFALLGFDDVAVSVAHLRDEIAFVDKCTLHGTRGVLAAYSFYSYDTLAAADIARAARTARLHNPAQLQLYVFSDAAMRNLVLGSFGVGNDLLTLTLDRGRIHAADLETLQEMVPLDGEGGVALAARHARALDRSRVTQRFFVDFAAQRDAISHAWNGVPAEKRQARDQLALLLLSRLMFLYFLQHRHHLANDTGYIGRLFGRWQRSRHATSFYRATLRPLFFYVLNRRVERRPERVARFGRLPYLNGGLFERHALERKYPRLDIPDDALAPAFASLLERYRFTAREASDAEAEGVRDLGVDPEMLGRVFEGLMAERTRETTGTFYTPAPTVDRLVRESLAAYLAPRLGAEQADALVQDADASQLDAEQKRFANSLLSDLRVLDPACGSGAFLLGSLSRIAQARGALGEIDVLAVRREIVARNLFGVDLQNDAAQLCALRLWLALVPDRAQGVQPLPNLDRQIRQGDSLVDPIDLRANAADMHVRQAIAEISAAGQQYVASEPEQRAPLQRALLKSECRLARSWVSALQRRMAHQSSELRVISAQKDLFGERTAEAKAAETALAELRQRGSELRRIARSINANGDHPFFSFAVHFSEAALQGFDLVICNPPWVRSHNWTAAVSALVRRRFEVCRATAWRPPHDSSPHGPGGHQVDLALLFLERAIHLLAPGGVLGIILPAKFMRSLSGAAARRLLHREMQIISLEDHSLDQRSIFQAASFTTVLVTRKRNESERSRPVNVSIVKRGGPPLKMALEQCELPLFAGDAGAPWLIVPRDVRSAIGRMMKYAAIGAQPELTVRRGVVTGANNVTVLFFFERKLSGLAAIRAEGYERAAQPQQFEAIVEAAAVSPLVRGCDLHRWKFSAARHLLHRSDLTPTPRAQRYVAAHNCALPSVQPKPEWMVAWPDIAHDFTATVVPAGVVALNTVYFIGADEPTAHLLCAYFNSLPFRTIARSIAERAKDAHFRFFAWTVSLLPLPACWRTRGAERLIALSRAAHSGGCATAEAQAEIDDIVSDAYELGRMQRRALTRFDEWLRS